MNDCVGICGRIFGHNFRPRMDITEDSGKWPFLAESTESQIAISVSNSVEYINATKSRKEKHLYDICVRCGKIIKPDNINNS